MSSTIDREVDTTTGIPDIREQPIGGAARSAAVILKRVRANSGTSIPVAGFQSSI